MEVTGTPCEVAMGIADCIAWNILLAKDVKN